MCVQCLCLYCCSVHWRQVLPRLVTVGRFDGVHPSIACATSSDNLLVHSPHRRGVAGELETRTINMNRTISALAAGDLEARSDRPRDVLLIGSSTSLQGYDVEANSDVFFKEVPDGVNALAFGTLASLAAPVAMVGGNCSLQGFNAQGQEVFWTVTGDNVSALAFREPNKDGKQEVRERDAPAARRCEARRWPDWVCARASTPRLSAGVRLTGADFIFCLLCAWLCTCLFALCWTRIVRDGGGR